MSDPRRKKLYEVHQCRLVANEINKLRGTDYSARPSESEPADVFLTSASGRHPELPVQVVTVPLDRRHRDDKHSVEKVRVNLANALAHKGVRHLFVGLILSGDAQLRGMSATQLELLAELIAAEAPHESTLRFNEIHEKAPGLEISVHTVILRHFDEIAEVEVSIPFGSPVPSDGRWIDEGVQMKIQRYGGPGAVRRLVLVIASAGFVEKRQVDEYRATHPPEAIPFSGVWVVTQFDGIFCLK